MKDTHLQHPERISWTQLSGSTEFYTGFVISSQTVGYTTTKPLNADKLLLTAAFPHARLKRLAS